MLTGAPVDGEAHYPSENPASYATSEQQGQDRAKTLAFQTPLKQIAPETEAPSNPAGLLPNLTILKPIGRARLNINQPEPDPPFTSEAQLSQMF